jgi:hypothetical protein
MTWWRVGVEAAMRKLESNAIVSYSKFKVGVDQRDNLLA